MSQLTIQQCQEMNLHYHYRLVINNLISYITSVSPKLSPSESGESSPPFHHGKFDSDSDLPPSPASTLFSSPLSSLHTLSLDVNSPRISLVEHHFAVMASALSSWLRDGCALCLPTRGDHSFALAFAVHVYCTTRAAWAMFAKMECASESCETAGVIRSVTVLLITGAWKKVNKPGL